MSTCCGYPDTVFDSIGWAEILVLVVAALFILGPERLPDAASWLGRNMRKLREFATGARQQLRDEVGPEFDELRKPLEDLKGLRDFDPKRAITQHLFDGDDDPVGLRDDHASRPMKPNGHATVSQARASRRGENLEPGEKPPVDPDAT